MKHQIVHALQKYVLNPPIKLLFALGIVPPGYALLETIGRKTGKTRRTPVRDGRLGKQFWLVAEHGMQAGDRSTLSSTTFNGQGWSRFAIPSPATATNPSMSAVACGFKSSRIVSFLIVDTEFPSCVPFSFRYI
jgi:hypothetical protein